MEVRRFHSDLGLFRAVARVPLSSERDARRGRALEVEDDTSSGWDSPSRTSMRTRPGRVRDDHRLLRTKSSLTHLLTNMTARSPQEIRQRSFVPHVERLRHGTRGDLRLLLHERARYLAWSGVETEAARGFGAPSEGPPTVAREIHAGKHGRSRLPDPACAGRIVARFGTNGASVRQHAVPVWGHWLKRWYGRTSASMDERPAASSASLIAWRSTCRRPLTAR